MKLTCGEFVGLAYANDDELREFAEEILAENAKLRELLQRTWNVFHDATGREFDAVKRDLREYGIEVGS